MKKQQRPIAEVLPIVQQMITTVSLASEIGKASSWIHNKQNHNVINGKEQAFTAGDVELINTAMCAIGKKLSASVIVYSENREDVIEQLRSIFISVRTRYVFCIRMGKSYTWGRIRMYSTSGNGNNCSFSPADILAINVAIIEIANFLLSTEMAL